MVSVKKNGLSTYYLLYLVMSQAHMYIRMTVEQSGDYKLIKEKILSKYCITKEKYNTAKLFITESDKEKSLTCTIEGIRPESAAKVCVTSQHKTVKTRNLVCG